MNWISTVVWTQEDRRPSSTQYHHSHTCKKKNNISKRHPINKDNNTFVWLKVFVFSSDWKSFYVIQSKWAEFKTQLMTWFKSEKKCNFLFSGGTIALGLKRTRSVMTGWFKQMTKQRLGRTFLTLIGKLNKKCEQNGSVSTLQYLYLHFL